MIKRILIGLGLTLVALLAIVIIAGAVIYVAFPSYTVSATRELSVAPDEAYTAFLDFSQWEHYFEYDELYPPSTALAVGTRFGYSASEGNMDVEDIELVPGQVIRFDMQSDTIDAIFSLVLEPTPQGTRATASNDFRSTGFLRVMIVVYALTGEVEAYYGNMLENVERVAIARRT